MDSLFQPFPMLAGRRAQIWRHQPAFRRPRHFHSEPELNVVTQGTCVLGVGDRRILVSAGQMLFFEPGQDHELLEASDDLELFVLALRVELAERALGARTLCSIPKSAIATDELPSIDAELSGLGDVRDASTVERRLAEIFGRAVARAPKAHVRSHRAVASMCSNRDASEGELARRLGAAPSDLSRRVHADLGVTLVEYRARLRLMHFVKLVDLGASLSRAALDADFGSYAQCHRVFRRILQCAPRDYFAGVRDRLDQATS